MTTLKQLEELNNLKTATEEAESVKLTRKQKLDLKVHKHIWKNTKTRPILRKCVYLEEAETTFQVFTDSYSIFFLDKEKYNTIFEEEKEGRYPTIKHIYNKNISSNYLEVKIADFMQLLKDLKKAKQNFIELAEESQWKYEIKRLLIMLECLDFNKNDSIIISLNGKNAGSTITIRNKDEKEKSQATLCACIKV